MKSLGILCIHLDNQTQTYRNKLSSGYRGEFTEMEKQIFEHISGLEQQVGVLSDVVQASLQIIDQGRPTQRAKKIAQAVWGRIRKLASAISGNIFFQIFGIIAALVTLWVWRGAVIRFMIRLIHR